MEEEQDLVVIDFKRPKFIPIEFFSDDYKLCDIVEEVIEEEGFLDKSKIIYLDRNVCILKHELKVFCFKDSDLYYKLIQ